MKKAILFGLVFGLFYSCAQKQEQEQTLYRTLELNIIGGKMYDELFLRTFSADRTVSFAGETVNGYQWTFTVPDSVIQKTASFSLRSPETTPFPTTAIVPTDSRFTTFLGVIDGDTLRAHEIHFDKNELVTYLTLEFSRTVREHNYQYFSELDTTVLMQEWYADYFFVNPNQNAFLKENMIDWSFGFFVDYFEGVKSYDDYLAELASKIKKNPNSFYYISRLASTLHFYKSKDDVERLFYLFSEEMQRSHFGQIVRMHFSPFKIDNVLLININTDKAEKIVKNSDRYTLLMLSASWCAPCRNSIPLLKEVHEKMSEFLDMVYITMDDESTLSDWKELMRSENISWRSLLFDVNMGLHASWSIIGIPDYLLVNPNMEARKIRLRDENDVNNLYSIVRHKNEN